MSTTRTAPTVDAAIPDGLEQAEDILTAEALDFVAELHRRFDERRLELLAQRTEKRREAAQRGRLDFLESTRSIREDESWSVPEAPPALRDRRVEITGPAMPAKMAINALNSGAKVWLADLEDASSPTWLNQVGGILNLRDAAHGTLAFTSPEGKQYRLREDEPTAVVVARPRGLHLPEHNVRIDGAPASASLVDFGLHFFHTAAALSEKGHGPYYYLPKLESHLEARLWNEVFTYAQERLGIAHGTVRATVLIETLPAAFEMEEILYELRDHASGLNAGRWDYLFSIIKTFRDAGEGFQLADRSTVTMTAPLMRAYTDLLVRTCHRRGAVAMGGMAAFIPNRREPEVTAAAFESVRQDKTREARDGFDGSWVAHPDLVAICKEVFDGVLGERPHQIDRTREDVEVTADQLLDIASAGDVRTEKELHLNLYVAFRYVAVWLSGNGAVAINNLMEDAATAEISRSQIWQQIRNGVVYQDTGSTATRELVEEAIAAQSETIRRELGGIEELAAHIEPAIELVTRLVLDEDYQDFLTLPAYEFMEAR